MNYLRESDVSSKVVEKEAPAPAVVATDRADSKAAYEFSEGYSAVPGSKLSPTVSPAVDVPAGPEIHIFLNAADPALARRAVQQTVAQLVVGPDRKRIEMAYSGAITSNRGDLTTSDALKAAKQDQTRAIYERPGRPKTARNSETNLARKKPSRRPARPSPALQHVRKIGNRPGRDAAADRPGPALASTFPNRAAFNRPQHDAQGPLRPARKAGRNEVDLPDTGTPEVEHGALFAKSADADKEKLV